MRDYLPEFLHLPERTPLFRPLAAHKEWTDRFMAEPTIMGVAGAKALDAYGIELIHPMREGRSPTAWLLSTSWLSGSLFSLTKMAESISLLPSSAFETSAIS